MDRGGHPREKPGAQHTLRVWKKRGDLDGAGRCAHLPVDKVEFAGLRVFGAIRQSELQAGLQFVRGLFLKICQESRGTEVFGFRNGEVHLHRIDLGELGEDGGLATRPHKVTDLRLGDAGNAIESRLDGAVVEIHLRGLHLCLGGCGCRDRGLRILIRCVVLLLADDFGLVELDLALQRDLLELGLCNRLRIVGLSLCESRLEGAGIDGEEEVTFFDSRALFVVLGEEIPGDLSLDVRILISVQQAHPLIRGDHIFLNRCGIRDHHGRDLWFWFLARREDNGADEGQGAELVSVHARIATSLALQGRVPNLSSVNLEPGGERVPQPG